MKRDPKLYFDTIYPSRGPKPAAGCTVADWEAHCKRVFTVPTEPPPPIIETPNPQNLPFSTDQIRSALDTSFKGHKSSGPSLLPSQLVKYLHKGNDKALSDMFNKVSTTKLPAKWNVVRVTPVHKKGDKTTAKNYRPVSVMGPLAKLYATCVNTSLDALATSNNWRAPTQAGFRKRHRLEDLLIPVDYIIARAQTRCQPLCLCFVDLEKAFDTVPRKHLMHILLEHYGVSKDMVETIRRMYVDTKGQAAGASTFFDTTMGVKQGCPMSPLLFGLFFDRVVAYIKDNTDPQDAVHVAFLAIQVALYADDVILIAPGPTHLQAQLDRLAAFASMEGLRISLEKTVTMTFNCEARFKINDKELNQSSEVKYLGLF